MNTLLLTAWLLSAPNPGLVAKEPLVDRGTVKAGVVLTQAFIVTNTLKVPVHIIDVTGTCGCMHPLVQDAIVQPGKSTQVSFEVNTLSQAMGSQSWKATVIYEPYVDGKGTDDKQFIELAIKAVVKREITVEPVAILMQGSKNLESEIVLTDSREKPLEIREAICSNKDVVLTVNKASDEKGKRSQKLVVRIANECPMGHFSEVILLKTNDPDYKELRVPLQFTKRNAAAVTLTPEQLTLRLGKGQTSISGLVRLQVADDKMITIDRIETGNAAITTKHAQGPGKMVTVRVTLDATMLKEDGKAKIRVFLREPSKEEIGLDIEWQLP